LLFATAATRVFEPATALLRSGWRHGPWHNHPFRATVHSEAGPVQNYCPNDPRFRRALPQLSSKTESGIAIWFGRKAESVNRWKNNIGQHLAKVRLRRGLTQDQLAAKLQISEFPMSRQVVANIEARRTRVSEEQIRHLVKVLRCSYEELFDGTPTPSVVSSGIGSNRRQ
jgi:hypothetical protein